MLGIRLSCASRAGLLLLTAAPTVGQSQPRTRQIDVQHLSIALRFDWPTKRAHGTTTITLAPLHATSTIRLDAGRLAIQSVTLANGNPVEFRYDGGDADDGLVVVLDRPRQLGEPVTLVIEYHTTWINQSDPNNLNGSNGKGLRFFAPTTTEPVKRRQIWSLGEPTGNRYWFPSYDAPDDLRTTDLRLTVPAPLTAIASGILVSSTTNPDGTRTFHWRADRPHPNHHTALVIGEYLDIPHQVDGVTLHSFGYPDEREAVAATIVRLPDMIRFFSSVTGARYPFPSYAQIFVQDLPWGAPAHMISTMTENMIDDARIHADYRWLWDGLEAEGLAAQWFGSHLPAKDWRHLWLNRGFAHYFDGLFNEHANGRAEFLLWHVQGDLATYLTDWQSGVRHPVVPKSLDDGLRFATDNYPSVRGALVLNMLRHQLGDALWWRAIRRYLAEHGGRPVTTMDFQRVVEAVNGGSLDWFFDQWLHEMGHPVFEVASRYDAAAKEVIVDVHQVQSDSTMIGSRRLFAGKLTLGVDSAETTVWLEAKPRNTIRLRASRRPRMVRFDVGGTWIAEVRFPKSVEALRYQLANDPDVVGQRWALIELTTRAGLATTSPADRSQILTAIRQAATGEHYWRIRYGALLSLASLLAPAGSDQPVRLDRATVATLRTVIDRDKAWVRGAAIRLLGMTRDSAYTNLYLGALEEPSHVTAYAAALALGLTGRSAVFGTLRDLTTVPSWKGETRLSGLLGLKALGDRRAIPIALAAVADQSAPRWTLATSRWDYRIAGAETLAALGETAAAFEIVERRFRQALAEDDINDVFSNLLLIATLADPRGRASFDAAADRYRDDPAALRAVETYRTQFTAALDRDRSR